jgi:hypothetical protein
MMMKRVFYVLALATACVSAAAFTPGQRVKKAGGSSVKASSKAFAAK